MFDEVEKQLSVLYLFGNYLEITEKIILEEVKHVFKNELLSLILFKAVKRREINLDDEMNEYKFDGNKTHLIQRLKDYANRFNISSHPCSGINRIIFV